MDIFSDLLVSLPASGDGLNTLWIDILNNWVKPIFLAAVAVFAVIFIKDRAWMKLIAFVGIAAVVGVLVFAGEYFFGSADAGLTKVASNLADQVNTIVLPVDKL
jgi:hypothetical protein